MSKSIVVVGSVAFDHVKTPAGERKESLGGSATYFSYSSSYFAPVKLVAVVGEDFSDKYIRLLNDKGIDTTGLVRQKGGETFRWAGTYEKDINEAVTLATDLNVFADFKPDLPESYRNSEFVFLANIDPDLQLEVLKQVRNPEYVVCDTMNLWINIKRDSLLNLLKKIDLMILNDGEARILTGQKNLIKAGKMVLELGPKTVIIKKGEHGAVAFSGPEIFMVPAYPVQEVVDPTGAGDTFAGGVVGYLCKSGATDFAAIKKAMLYGTVMASFNVQDFSLDNLKNLTPKMIDERVQCLRSITSC
ncbi:MAG: PfkB family carbohydrate kinase [Candidatus Auribacterota bacterium]